MHGSETVSLLSHQSRWTGVRAGGAHSSGIVPKINHRRGDQTVAHTDLVSHLKWVCLVKYACWKELEFILDFWSWSQHVKLQVIQMVSQQQFSLLHAWLSCSALFFFFLLKFDPWPAQPTLHVVFLRSLVSYNYYPIAQQLHQNLMKILAETLGWMTILGKKLSIYLYSCDFKQQLYLLILLIIICSFQSYNIQFYVQID